MAWLALTHGQGEPLTAEPLTDEHHERPVDTTPVMSPPTATAPRPLAITIPPRRELLCAMVI